MIKLFKTAKPQILIDHADEWTQILLDKEASGEVATSVEKTRYRHPEIKAALVTETNGKCAYCESKLRHIHHGDIEHMMPKSLQTNKILDWNNLTLACEICNQNKSNIDPNSDNIIDPYDVDPRDHLMFIGPFIFDRGTALGISTNLIIDLKRPDLFERRRERMDTIMSLYATVLRPDIPLVARRAIYKDIEVKETAASQAYSAMSQDLIDAMRIQVPAEVKDELN
jgi:hypothetical protein